MQFLDLHTLTSDPSLPEKTRSAVSCLLSWRSISGLREILDGSETRTTQIIISSLHYSVELRIYHQSLTNTIV